MSKLKDMIPSANKVMDDPWKWFKPTVAEAVLPGAGTVMGFKNNQDYGKSQHMEDVADIENKRAYDAAHPAPISPSRTDTTMAGAKRAALRRKSGRVSTVLSDETLG